MYMHSQSCSYTRGWKIPTLIGLKLMGLENSDPYRLDSYIAILWLVKQVQERLLKLPIIMHHHHYTRLFVVLGLHISFVVSF